MDFGVGVTCGDDPEVGGTITNAGMSGWNDGVDFSPYPTPTGEIVNVLGTGFDNESPVVLVSAMASAASSAPVKSCPDKGPKVGSSMCATGLPASTPSKAFRASVGHGHGSSSPADPHSLHGNDTPSRFSDWRGVFLL